MRTNRKLPGGTIRPEVFSETLRYGFTEAMVKEADHFRHRFNLPSDGGIRLEAFNLLGTIYASLYDEFAHTEGKHVCENPGCLVTFDGRSDKRTCRNNCRRALNRIEEKLQKASKPAARPV